MLRLYAAICVGDLDIFPSGKILQHLELIAGHIPACSHAQRKAKENEDRSETG
jgi:hypothetical protein